MNPRGEEEREETRIIFGDLLNKMFGLWRKRNGKGGIIWRRNDMMTSTNNNDNWVVIVQAFLKGRVLLFGDQSFSIRRVSDLGFFLLLHFFRLLHHPDVTSSGASADRLAPHSILLPGNTFGEKKSFDHTGTLACDVITVEGRK